jgi:hypothetical protein
MLQFMEEHRDLAQNRVQGLDAKKRATALWDQLTSHLNSCGNGATKSTDKWMKVKNLVENYIQIKVI